MLFLAEITPSTGMFWEYSNPPPGMIAAGIFFLALICVGVAVDVGMVLYGIKRPTHTSELRNELTARVLPWQIVLIFFGLLTGFYLLASWLFHFAGIRGGELFGLDWKKIPARLGLSALFYLAMLPPLWLISALYQLLLQKAGIPFSLQDVAEVLTAPASWPLRTALFFIVICVAPAFEEIVFRGILLPFAVRRLGFWPGIFLISLIFGGLHLHLPSFLPLFLLSVVFCLAYARTRSLWVPVGMHMLFNAVTVVLVLLIG